MQKQITFNVPENELAALKIYSIRQHKTMTLVMNEIIRGVVEGKIKPDVDDQPKVRTSAKVDEELLAQFEEYAKRYDSSISNLLQQSIKAALDAAVNEPEPSRRRERV